MHKNTRHTASLQNGIANGFVQMAELQVSFSPTSIYSEFFLLILEMKNKKAIEKLKGFNSKGYLNTAKPLNQKLKEMYWKSTK